jgi:hypothetical protein
MARAVLCLPSLIHSNLTVMGRDMAELLGQALDSLDAKP